MHEPARAALLKRIGNLSGMKFLLDGQMPPCQEGIFEATAHSHERIHFATHPLREPSYSRTRVIPKSPWSMEHL